jgi:microcystin-dependent protein
MTADTYTSSIGILQQGTGNNNNSWGTLLNAGLQVADDAIAGRLDSTVTGGTLDLSGTPPPAGPSQARYAYLFFSGILTSNQTVIVPNLSKFWFIQNGTTGAFSFFVKTTGGAAIQIPQGSLKRVFCYTAGSGSLVREDFYEIGELKDFALATVPNGYLECGGAAYSRTNYPDLFAKISTTWGLGTGGDVTTFGVPNLKDTGRFRRSRTGSVAVGTYQANQNLAHTHTGTATGTTDATGTDHTHGVSITSGGQSATHTHTASNNANFVGANHAAFNLAGGATDIPNSTLNMQSVTTGVNSVDHTHLVSGNTGGQSANHTHTFASGTFTTASSGASEARPEAAVVLSCIRY